MSKKARIIILGSLCSIIIISIAFILLAFQANKNKEALAGRFDKKEKIQVMVVGDRNYPPYEFVDSNNEFKGYNVDIIRAVAIESGLDISIRPMVWNDALNALKNGDVNIVQGITDTDARRKYFDFSDFTLKNSQVIFVRKENAYINYIDDLKGKIVGFQKGDVSGELVSKVDNINISSYANQEQAIKALLDKKIDAYIGERLTGIYFTQKINRSDELKIVGTSLSDSSYSIAVKSGNKELLDRINDGLSKIKSNGTYDTIYKKWFGEDINTSTDSIKQYIYVLGAILASVVILSVAFYIINRSLKIKIEKRTSEIAESKDLLAKSDRLKDMIFDNIESGIIAFDEYGYVTKANRYASYLLNTELNDTMTWTGLSLDKHLEHGIFENSLTGQAWKQNVSWYMSSGEIKYLDVAAVPIRGPKDYEGLVILMHDYTPEKILQDSMRQKDKMESVGRLAASVAHEIRNPLSSIKLYIDMIPSRIDNEEFKSKIIKILPQEIERLNSLVTILLDYSKPIVSEPSKLSLNEIIFDVVGLLSPKIKLKKINITEPISDIGIISDEDQLKQVLINIILNAIDAIDEIGENGKISITSRFTNENRAEITITDNGSGIDPQNTKKIFEPFYSTKHGGYGLGLSLSQQLVEENEGEIIFESVKGVGTKFILTFNGYVL